MERKLMNDTEISEYTGLSLWAINELRRRGEIPYIKLPGIRKYYYEKESIDKWIGEQEQRSIQSEKGMRAIR